jgi:hypothetical protein
MRSERQDITPSALFLLIFLLYLLFLCPTVYNGDSPLFETSAFGLGLAHPPGYPLYVMLGKVITFVPFGSVAFKMNLLSAISGAAASLLVFKSVELLTKDRAAAIFAALLSALIPLAWGESTKAEVYTLNSALAMAVFYLGLRFMHKKDVDRRLLIAASFILGVGMGNHHTIGFMLLPLAFALLLRAREEKTALYCLLFFSLGIVSIYTLGFVRSQKFLSEGALFAYSDMSSLGNLVTTFFRTEYHSSASLAAAPAHDPTSFLRGLQNVSRYLLYGNLGIVSLLALFSVPLAMRKKRTVSFVLVAFGAYALVMSSMVYAFAKPSLGQLFLLNPYLLPLLYITSALAGLGAFYVLSTISLRIPDLRRPLALGLVLLPLVLTLPDTLRDGNLSGYYLAEDYSKNLLDSLPPESVYITVSDASYFPLAYSTFVGRKREDVMPLYGDADEISTQVSPRWHYAKLFPDIASGGHFSQVGIENLRNRPLYSFEPAFLPKDFQSALKATPFINSYRLTAASKKIDEAREATAFEHAFKLMVYERTLGERSSDIYSQELKMSMFVPVSHYAYLMNKGGDKKLSHRYYGDALKLITPKGIAHYAIYLNNSGRKDELEEFLEGIEPYSLKDPGVRRLGEEITKQFM